MAEEKFISKINLPSGDYLIKDSKARTDIATLQIDLASEVTRATEAEAGLQDQIDDIEEGLVKVKSGDKILALDGTSKELSTTLTFNYDENSRKILLKGVGGTSIGEVNCDLFIKDGMLLGTQAFVATGTSHEVTIKGNTHTFTGLVKGHQYLAFCFTDGAVPTPTLSWEIADLQDLVDVYTAGNGIDITNNVVSIKLDTASDEWLSVGEDGLKLSGDIRTRIETAEGDISELDVRLTTADGEIDTLQADVTSLGTRVTTAEGDINSLKTKITTAEGDIDDLESEVAGIKTDYVQKSGDTMTGALSFSDGVNTIGTIGLASGGSSLDITGIYQGIALKATGSNGYINFDSHGNNDGTHGFYTFSGKEGTSSSRAVIAVKSDVEAETTRATNAEEALGLQLNGVDARVTTIEDKESGWDAKLDNVKLGGNWLEVKSDVAGKGQYVDLGNIATTEGVLQGVDYVTSTRTLTKTSGTGTTTNVHTFGALADKSSATGTVAGQTITGVKATGDLSGTASINKTEVTASKVKTAGTLPTFTYGAFTPNTPTVIDTTKFNGGSKAADTFTQGTQADLTTSNITYVEEGISATVNKTTETLVIEAITAKSAKAVNTFTANILPTFTEGAYTAASLGTGFYTAGTAASKVEDTFTQGAMPTFDEVKADKVNSATAAVTIEDAELAVGTITVAEKSVTVE